MNIAVQGLWHLGSVTSICLASLDLKILAIDNDPRVIENFQRDLLPVYEPGLEALFKENKNKITFSTDFDKLRNVDLLWVAYDTPVDKRDNADIDFVIRNIKQSINFLPNDAVIVISSQLPVGSIKKLEFYALEKKKKLNFAYSPENLRLGDALNVFLKPDRIVVGCRDDNTKKKLNKILKKITQNIIWVSVESAEMTKHAINSFLALSVSFANELASICEKVGADAKEVEIGLKSDIRIGMKAYLGPGGPFAGGTLARDIKFLDNISKSSNLKNNIISSVFKSNNNHKLWHQRIINEELNNLIPQKKFLVLGLTYKPNTNTLRRSQSIELIKWILENDGIVDCFDPVISNSTHTILKKTTLLKKVSHLESYDVIIVATPWKEFIDFFDFNTLERKIKGKCIIFDQHRLLSFNYTGKKIKYITVGFIK